MPVDDSCHRRQLDCGVIRCLGQHMPTSIGLRGPNHQWCSVATGIFVRHLHLVVLLTPSFGVEDDCKSIHLKRVANMRTHTRGEYSVREKENTKRTRSAA